jgi:signal transduction histidine kinase
VMSDENITIISPNLENNNSKAFVVYFIIVTSIVVIAAYIFFFVFFNRYFYKEIQTTIILGHIAPIVATLLAFIYFYAYRYLNETPYVYISIGWFVNALYLPLELFFRNPCHALEEPIKIDGSTDCFEFKVSVYLFSLISTIAFFYAAILNSRENRRKLENYHDPFRKIKKFLIIFGIPIFTIINLLIIYYSHQVSHYLWGGISEEGINYFLTRFSISSSFGSLFSMYVLFYLGYTFQKSSLYENKDKDEVAGEFFIWLFPYTFYAYAALQICYPFNLHFSLYYPNVYVLLFVCGMICKLANLVCLISILLRKKFPDYLQAESKVKIAYKDRQNIQSQLLAANTELKRVTQLASLGAIAASVEHDIQTPIASLETNIESLKIKAGEDRLLGDKIGKILKEIEYEKNRISASANIIRFIRAEEDFYRRKGFMNKLSVQKALTHAIKSAKTELNLDTQKYFFRHNLQNKDFFIYAFEEMIVQILVNLFKNSYEAIQEANKDKGVIRINVSQIKNLPANVAIKNRNHEDFAKWIQIDITDEGKGIPEHIINEITEIFTTKDKPNGGIGLFIGKRLLRIHDSIIDFTSKLDVGTTVSLYFPESTVYKEFLEQQTKDNNSGNYKNIGEEAETENDVELKENLPEEK